MPILDLRGRRFGAWLVLVLSDRKHINGGVKWSCRCDCGNEKAVTSQSLVAGTSTCCEDCRPEKRKAKTREIYNAELAAGKAKCSRCKQEKALKDFPQGRTNSAGNPRYKYCKLCHIDYQEAARLQMYFNISPEERDQIFAHQKNVCFICQRAPRNGKRLAVDHNHKTGLIRGGLCWYCNRVVGMFRDDIQRFARVVDYLNNPPATEALGGPRYGRLGKVSNKASTTKGLDRERQKREEWLLTQEV